VSDEQRQNLVRYKQIWRGAYEIQRGDDEGLQRLEALWAEIGDPRLSAEAGAYLEMAQKAVSGFALEDEAIARERKEEADGQEPSGGAGDTAGPA